MHGNADVDSSCSKKCKLFYNNTNWGLFLRSFRSQSGVDFQCEFHFSIQLLERKVDPSLDA